MTAAGFSAPSLGTGGLGVTNEMHAEMAEVRAGVVRHACHVQHLTEWPDGDRHEAEWWTPGGPSTAWQALASRVRRLKAQGRTYTVDGLAVTFAVTRADGDTITTTLTYSDVTS